MDNNHTKIVDNFLHKELYQRLYDVMMSADFAWFHNSSVAQDYSKDGIYFTHSFYNNYTITSNHFNLVKPIIDVIKPKALIRVKGNLYTKTHQIYEHDAHTDYRYNHKGFLFYINTNNGFTKISNKKVMSVANRGVYFDSSKPHNSSTCSDESVRVNININYF